MVVSGEAEAGGELAPDLAALLLRTTEDLIVVLDATGRITLVSPTVEERTGRSAAELLGQPVGTLVGPGDAPALDQGLRDLRAAAVPAHLETTVPATGGADRVVSWKMRSVVERDGTVAHILLSGTDVTETRRLERANAELGLELHFLTRTLPIGYFAATVEPGPLRLRIRAANEPFVRLTGRAPTADEPLDLADLVGAGHQSTVTAAVDAVTRADRFESRLTVRHAHGSPTRALLRLEPIAGEEGPVQGCIGWLLDLSAETRARHDADRRARVLDAAADLVLEALSTGEVLDANDAVRRAADRPVGHVGDLFDDESVDALLTDAAVTVRHDIHWQGELRVVTPSGTKVPVAVTVLAGDAPTTAGADEPIRLSIVAHDVSELRSLEHHLVRLSLHDELTGLPNRELVLDRLEQALDRATRSQEFVGVLVLDLDYFKSVNDDLGHDAGDELLRMSAGRLRAALRPADTVARLSGDEFLVILEGIHEPQGVVAIADRIRTTLVKPFTIAGRSVRTSASIGVSVAKNNKVTPQELMAQADTAAFRAKEGGRNRYELFWESPEG